MDPEVLLAVADLRLRAPLRAQLIEEGFAVHAVSSWDEAELLLLKRALRPRLTLVDLDGEPNPAAIPPALVRLAGAANAMVLTSAAAGSVADLRAAGLAHVLPRPFSIGDAVAGVRAVLRS
jgi:DNA-binding response OmpR family regulator